MVVKRHAFRKRVKGAQESIVQYIAALRELAATWEFSNTDDMIQDQLVEHVANPRIRERLLLKANINKTLTLAEAITIATHIESASEQAKSMAGDQHLSVHVQSQNTARSHDSHVRALL